MGFADIRPDERGQLLEYLRVQRAALAGALSGLTEEQARSTPSASEMSLAALLKHLTAVERRWVLASIAGRPAGVWPVADWDAEWQLTDADTVPALLAGYAAAAAETEEVVAGVPDLGADCHGPEGEQPPTVRWVLLHLLEETARHAGHADVIRESIDGAHVEDLVD